MGCRATKNCRGFTLIEVVLVTILMAIVGLMSFLFIITGVSGFVSTLENTTLAQKAGLALARITAELTGEADAILLIDPLTGIPTYVKYQYQNAPPAFRHIALMGSGARKEIKIVDRPTPEPQSGDTSVLIDGVSAFTLAYKKSDGSAWVVADGMDDLAWIEIALTLFVNDTDPETRTFQTFLTLPRLTDVILTRAAGRGEAGGERHG